MTFKSILFDQEIFQIEELVQPEYFTDLFLDQVVDAKITPKKDNNLNSNFYFPLQSTDLIKFRIEIFKDLENQEIFKAIENFSKEFSNVRGGLNLIKYIEDPSHKMSWHLEVALTYCHALDSLSELLEKNQLNSKGLTELKTYLFNYINSTDFKQLYSEASKVKSELQTIRYSINIESGSFTVQKYKGEQNYTDEVLSLFERFREKKEKSIIINNQNKKGMNHIDA